MFSEIAQTDNYVKQMTVPQDGQEGVVATAAGLEIQANLETNRARL